jgi:hypothetical protein
MAIPIHPDSQRLLEQIGLLRPEPTPAPNPYPPSSTQSQSSAYGSGGYGPGPFRSDNNLYASQSSSQSRQLAPSVQSVPSMQPMQPASANMMMLGAQRPPPDVGGVHALMSVSDGYVYIDQLSPGGQLAMNGVEEGDALVSIDRRSVVGLSLRAVKAQLEGPAYSSVVLGFERGSEDEPETYSIEVVRTPLVSEVNYPIHSATQSCYFSIQACMLNFDRSLVRYTCVVLSGKPSPTHTQCAMHEQQS